MFVVLNRQDVATQTTESALTISTTSPSTQSSAPETGARAETDIPAEATEFVTNVNLGDELHLLL